MQRMSHPQMHVPLPTPPAPAAALRRGLGRTSEKRGELRLRLVQHTCRGLCGQGFQQTEGRQQHVANTACSDQAASAGVCAKARRRWCGPTERCCSPRNTPLGCEIQQKTSVSFMLLVDHLVKVPFVMQQRERLLEHPRSCVNLRGH